MKQFCNKKRQREKENDQSLDEFILSNNKKEKKSQILVPQDNSININLIENNKLDKYSNSTLQSKNDFLFESKKEEIFKIINYNNKENKIENNIIKMIETSIFDTILPSRTKAKSYKEIRSFSLSSENYRNSYSDYSLPEDYFPFEIGEIIQNKYEVIIYNI